MRKRVYVLHEIGAPNHYVGLKALCVKKDIELTFREFSIFRDIAKSVYRSDLSFTIRALRNACFLISLAFSERRVIVIGIAPFDWRMILLLPLIKRHYVFYHTSHTTWKEESFPKNSFLSRTKTVRGLWKCFILNVQSIFAVSNKTAQSLRMYYRGISNVLVVSHTSNLMRKARIKIASKRILKEKVSEGSLTCLFAGRIVKEKGILTFLNIVKVCPFIDFRIAGKGKLVPEVMAIIKAYDNCTYLGYLDKEALSKEYKKADILLNPSLRSSNWEELFGISIIEAMSYGVIPFCTDHTGPKEILGEVEELIMSETSFEESVVLLLKKYHAEREKLRRMKLLMLKISLKYCQEVVSNHWKPVIALFR